MTKKRKRKFICVKECYPNTQLGIVKEGTVLELESSPSRHILPFPEGSRNPVIDALKRELLKYGIEPPRISEEKQHRWMFSRLKDIEYAEKRKRRT